MRHTKIVATLGPASSDGEVIDALVDAGVDVFRLNFSHGTHAGHASSFHRVREAARRARRHISVLQDLSGPKIRTGRLAGGGPVTLVPDRQLTIVIGDIAGTAETVSTSYAPLARAVGPGDRLLLDDGRLELRVVAVDDMAIRTRVVVGGLLAEHKGINAPNVPLPAVGVTEKDASDLAFGLALGVDLVALSFVQSAADIVRARALADDAGRGDVPIVAKLERPEAIDRLDEIMAAADAVMVARGDLGLEVPFEQVPRLQKEVLRVAHTRGVPVIVATQVMESMRANPMPTRAEVSDAAGAADAGAAAIMLSGETAIGHYPVRSVQVLDRVIREAESVPPPWTWDATPDGRADHVAALSDAAAALASRREVDAIVAVTREGRTARLVAARRPPVPIYAATPSDELARRLALWRGVVPLVVDLAGDVDAVSDRITDVLATIGVPDDTRIAVVNASPRLDRDAANFIRILAAGLR